MLCIPNRINSEGFKIEFKDYDNRIIEVPAFHTHYTEGGISSCSDFYPNYKEALSYSGAVTYSKLGNALVYCCDAVKCHDTIQKLWMKADYDLCIDNRTIPESYYKDV